MRANICKRASRFSACASFGPCAPRDLLHGEPRSVSAALAAVLVASLRHDRAAHRGRAESDQEGGEQQRERNAGRAVGEDQLAQMPGVEPEQAADQQRRGAGADREVDGEQAEQRDAEKGGARHSSGLLVGHGGLLHAGFDAVKDRSAARRRQRS